MSRASGIIKKLDNALKRLNPVDVTVYKRLNSSTGGDTLIGRPGSQSHVDTLLVPQPMYQRLGRNVVGDSAPSQQLGVGQATSRIGVDYQIIFSPSSITKDELNNRNITYVFKDAAGGIEIYHLTDYEPTALQGQDVMYVAYLRSAVR